ncbi:amino acid ABC transporter permease [Anaerobacillus alkalidiazotrophicus]|uniref:Amino acid ABC transporter permease n=1 Tax=Anaerobacillus alkalidiazotrophicus TaxID=472963 RepID=A0A1S2M2G8_9BACI|nr:amino acid ABC transporter permease [Anaerobacillus alkalidiazotrophicus]
MNNNSEVKLPPQVKITPLKWVKENLFNSWLNGIVTIILTIAIFLIVKSTLEWVFFSANWSVVEGNFKLLLVGQYPLADLWRVWLSLSVVSLLLGLSYGINKGIIQIFFTVYLVLFGIALLLPFVTLQSKIWVLTNICLVVGGWFLARKFKGLSKWTWLGWVLCFPITVFLLNGFGLLPEVKTNIWGGFLLTLLISLVAILFSFPIGVLLALGRTSKLPVIRWMSIIYIEIIRGVPLITVIFMAQIMLPLFLPAGVTIDNIVRTMVAFTLFNAAYIAENVRGGLQSIPKSQYEAAQALGLSTVKMTTFVILPQALRVTIPSMVGQSISIFKDTTLVAVVGIVELLGIGRTIISNPKFLGTQMEVFLFVAVVFWIFSYTMSLTSKRIEEVVRVEHR